VFQRQHYYRHAPHSAHAAAAAPAHITRLGRDGECLAGNRRRLPLTQPPGFTPYHSTPLTSVLQYLSTSVTSHANDWLAVAETYHGTGLRVIRLFDALAFFRPPATSSRQAAASTILESHARVTNGRSITLKSSHLVVSQASAMQTSCNVRLSPLVWRYLLLSRPQECCSMP
jgi:hypothetical protein